MYQQVHRMYGWSWQLIPDKTTTWTDGAYSPVLRHSLTPLVSKAK